MGFCLVSHQGPTQLCIWEWGWSRLLLGWGVKAVCQAQSSSHHSPLVLSVTREWVLWSFWVSCVRWAPQPSCSHRSSQLPYWVSGSLSAGPLSGPRSLSSQSLWLVLKRGIIFLLLVPHAVMLSCGALGPRAGTTAARKAERLDQLLSSPQPTLPGRFCFLSPVPAEGWTGVTSAWMISDAGAPGVWALCSCSQPFCLS